MAKEIVKPGKLVTLTYSIQDKEGKVLEQNDLPVSYVHGGATELIGGMDRAVLGRSEGDTVKLNLTPEQGFGAHDPDLTFTDDIDNVPPQFRHLGAEVQMQNEEGDVRTFHVTSIENGRLTVDGNHPLAGKHLTVRVQILEVRDPRPEDLNPNTGSCMIN